MTDAEGTRTLVEGAWTETTIAERSRHLADSLRARGHSAEALSACAPGGARNPVADPLGAAITQYALLRAEWELARARQEREAMEAEQAVAEALGNAPVPVATARAGTHAVHPKGYMALRFLDFLDAAAQDAAATALRIADLAHGDTREGADALALAPLVDSLAVKLWLWVITHPDPGLPFNPTAAKAEPPAWTDAIMPEDLFAFWQAHFTVNRRRVELIAALFPAERQAESRLSLAGFLGTSAHEFGERPSALLNQWTLGEVFAQAITAAQSAREARAQAERDRGATPAAGAA